MRLRDMRGGLRCAREIAGIDRPDTLAAQRAPERMGLTFADRRKQDVGLSLKAMRRIPRRLAVTDQNQFAQRRALVLRAGAFFFAGTVK